MKLENTTEHPIAITLGGKPAEDGKPATPGHTVLIPRGHGGEESNINGFAPELGSDGLPTGNALEFDAEEVAAAKLDPVVKSWFDSGALIAAADANAPAPIVRKPMAHVTVEDEPKSAKHSYKGDR